MLYKHTAYRVCKTCARGGGEKSEVWKLIGLSNTRLKAEIVSENTYTSAVQGIAGTKITTTEKLQIELAQ